MGMPSLPRGTAAPLLAPCLLQAPPWAGGSPVLGAFCGSGGQELKSAGVRQSRAAQGPNGWLQGCRDVTTSCFVFQLKSSVPASSCFTRGLRQLLLMSLSACVPSTGHTWVSLMQGHR